MKHHFNTYLVCSHCHEDIVKQWAGDEIFRQCEACGIYDAQSEDMLELDENEYEELIP